MTVVVGLTETQESLWMTANILGLIVVVAVAALLTILVMLVRKIEQRVETIKTTLEAIKKNTPKAAGANAVSFIDTSIVDQLVKEGYYK